MERPQNITVRVLKHDGKEYRRWRASLRSREDSLLILDAEFEADVSHELLGEIKRATKTVEYYWLNRWYNVFRFLKDDGSTRLWYCNVNTPPRFESETLSYIDLDIDVLVQPDFSFQVLDEDEFEANALLYGYSDEEKVRAHAATDELTGLIKQHQFPFLPEYSSPSSVANS